MCIDAYKVIQMYLYYHIAILHPCSSWTTFVLGSSSSCRGSNCCPRRRYCSTRWVWVKISPQFGPSRKHLLRSRHDSPVQAQAFCRSREENGGDEAAPETSKRRAWYCKTHELITTYKTVWKKHVKTWNINHDPFDMKAHQKVSQQPPYQGSSEYIIQIIQ